MANCDGRMAKPLCGLLRQLACKLHMVHPPPTDSVPGFNGMGIGGYSLLPFLQDPGTTEWEGPEGALTMLGVGINQEEVMQQTYSYRTKDWRYIRYMNGQEELYDLQNDPYEWENLAGDQKYQEVREKMSQGMMDIIDRKP